MFWFEIFVLKLSLVYDVNLCNVIFWMFLWDLFQWFVIIFHSIDSQVKSTDYSCERLLRKKMENMSSFKYILSNQWWIFTCRCAEMGTFLSPLIKLNVDIVFTQILLHVDHIGKKYSCSSSMFRTWLEPEEFVNTITQWWFHFTNFQIPIT